MHQLRACPAGASTGRSERPWTEGSWTTHKLRHRPVTPHGPRLPSGKAGSKTQLPKRRRWASTPQTACHLAQRLAPFPHFQNTQTTLHLFNKVSARATAGPSASSRRWTESALRATSPHSPASVRAPGHRGPTVPPNAGAWALSAWCCVTPRSVHTALACAHGRAPAGPAPTIATRLCQAPLSNQKRRPSATNAHHGN